MTPIARELFGAAERVACGVSVSVVLGDLSESAWQYFIPRFDSWWWIGEYPPEDAHLDLVSAAHVAEAEWV